MRLGMSSDGGKSSDRLQGKAAIVTGGGAGIGGAISILFAREKARVAVADIDFGAAQATAAKIAENGGSALALRADVRSAGEVERMVRDAVTALGGLDILVNNAGVGTDGDVVQLPEEEWRRVLDVNLTGVFLCCKYAIPHMKRGGGGSIVNIASIAARVGGSVSCVYPASKAGVVALSRNTALKFAVAGIRVNCVCPGHVDTALTYTLKDPRVRKALIGSYPMGRLGTAEEIAAAVLFLASDESSFVTGSELVVDGGYTAQ
jgi:NAD(P)-dependent dehydrogenase (short-subunit alcohol dehydrogenase family)